MNNEQVTEDAIQGDDGWKNDPWIMDHLKKGNIHEEDIIGSTAEKRANGWKSDPWIMDHLNKGNITEENIIGSKAYLAKERESAKQKAMEEEENKDNPSAMDYVQNFASGAVREAGKLVDYTVGAAAKVASIDSEHVYKTLKGEESTRSPNSYAMEALSDRAFSHKDSNAVADSIKSDAKQTNGMETAEYAGKIVGTLPDSYAAGGLGSVAAKGIWQSSAPVRGEVLSTIMKVPYVKELGAKIGSNQVAAKFYSFMGDKVFKAENLKFTPNATNTTGVAVGAAIEHNVKVEDGSVVGDLLRSMAAYGLGDLTTGAAVPLAQTSGKLAKVAMESVVDLAAVIKNPEKLYTYLLSKGKGTLDPNLLKTIRNNKHSVTEAMVKSTKEFDGFDPTLDPNIAEENLWKSIETNKKNSPLSDRAIDDVINKEQLNTLNIWQKNHESEMAYTIASALPSFQISQITNNLTENILQTTEKILNEKLVKYNVVNAFHDEFSANEKFKSVLKERLQSFQEITTKSYDDVKALPDYEKSILITEAVDAAKRVSSSLGKIAVGSDTPSDKTTKMSEGIINKFSKKSDDILKELEFADGANRFGESISRQKYVDAVLENDLRYQNAIGGYDPKSAKIMALEKANKLYDDMLNLASTNPKNSIAKLSIKDITAQMKVITDLAYTGSFTKDERTLLNEINNGFRSSIDSAIKRGEIDNKLGILKDIANKAHIEERTFAELDIVKVMTTGENPTEIFKMLDSPAGIMKFKQIMTDYPDGSDVTKLIQRIKAQQVLIEPFELSKNVNTYEMLNQYKKIDKSRLLKELLGADVNSELIKNIPAMISKLIHLQENAAKYSVHLGKGTSGKPTKTSDVGNLAAIGTGAVGALTYGVGGAVAAIGGRFWLQQAFGNASVNPAVVKKLIKVFENGTPDAQLSFLQKVYKDMITPINEATKGAGDSISSNMKNSAGMKVNAISKAKDGAKSAYDKADNYLKNEDPEKKKRRHDYLDNREFRPF